MTLAFTLINPILLYAGAAMASIPIIIHLLNRRRFKRMVWAAMEFLLAAHKKNAKRLRVENLILLILRTLIILMLALAMARPVLEGFLATLGRSNTHRILIIDDTYSMGARQGVDGESVINQVRQAAKWLVGTFNESDAISIIRVGSQPHMLGVEPSRNHENIIERLDVMQASDAAGSKAAALAVARKVVEESKLERKIVYIMTDNTRVAWTGDNGEHLAPTVAALAEEAGVIIVDFGRPGRSNLAISDLSPVRSVVTRGVRNEFRVAVMNASDIEIGNVMVEMKVGGKVVDSIMFNAIPAGKELDRKWSHSFDTEGTEIVEAHIRDLPEDALVPDSSRYLAVEVKDAINVLLVNGEPRNVPVQDEVHFLQHALDPRGPDRRRVNPYLVRTVVDTQFTEDMIETGQDVIVLANVATVEPRVVSRLESFVREGGSLMVYLGGQVRVSDYNRDLFRGGEGLLPAGLGDVLGSTEPGDESRHAVLDGQSLAHPAMSVFKASNGAGFDKFRAFKYFDLKLPINSDGVEPILSFTTGQPVALEKRFGRGRVVLWSTTADPEWNNFQWDSGFMILHQILQHLTPDTRWRFNRLVNSQTSLPVSASQINSMYILERPDGTTQDMKPEALSDGRTGLPLQDLSRQGVYRLNLAGQSQHQVVANVDVHESDLAHLPEEEMRAALGGAPVVLANGFDGLQAQLKQQQAAGGWARNLLFITLALVLLETFLAWYFNRNV